MVTHDDSKHPKPSGLSELTDAELLEKIARASKAEPIPDKETAIEYLERMAESDSEIDHLEDERLEERDL